MLPIVIFERILDFLELKEKFYLAVVAELDHWLMRKNNVALGIASWTAHHNFHRFWLVDKITNQGFSRRFQATPELIFWMLKSENVSEEVKEIYQEEIEYRINIFWSNLLSHLKYAQRYRFSVRSPGPSVRCLGLPNLQDSFEWL